MTQQTETTRRKISAMLEQVGMTDEELYQLLYGRKQEVEIDIALPQLMDEDIWLETEHTEEELSHISAQLAVLEHITTNTLEESQIAALETILEGELISDDARGLMLGRSLKNWRKGMSQFLAFLAFSNLQKLALSVAALTAPNQIAQFEQMQNRPQGRRTLIEFILAQLEKPLPALTALLAEHGAILGATGTLEFNQPLTAALLQQSPEKIAQMLRVMERDASLQLTENNYPLTYGEYNPDAPQGLTKYSTQKPKRETAAELSAKLVLLDRMENLIAHKQALMQTQPSALKPMQQSVLAGPRRPRGTRRRLNEALEREAKEKAASTATNNTLPHETEKNAETKSSPHQKQETHAQRIASAQARQQQAIANSVRTKTQGLSSKKTVTASSPAPTEQPIANAPATDISGMKNLFADLPLNALKGITASHVDAEQLGKTKSSLAKDISHTTAQKPETSYER